MGGKRKKHKPTYKPKPEPLKRRVEPTHPPLLVFVSSLIPAMRKERDIVAQTIDSFTIARPWLFEYTPASSLEVRESYMSVVPRCDIFVILLAYKYSEEVEREYHAAIETKKPILAFVHNGEKDDKQVEFVNSITKKRAHYNDLSDLSEQVWAAIYDQVLLMARTSEKEEVLIRPEDTPALIENMPLKLRKPEEMAGYLIVGLENDAPGRMYAEIFTDYFHIQAPPEDLNQINPSYVPVYIENLIEMNQAAQAIATANKRSRSDFVNREKIFSRELKREVLDIATRHIMRQEKNEPEPDLRMAGSRYQIWALEPNLSRLFKLARLEGTLKEPSVIKRGANEFLFKTADRFTRIMTAIQESVQKAQGDNEEFQRLLMVEAGLIATEDYEEEQEDKQKQKDSSANNDEKT